MPIALVPEGFTLKKVTKAQEDALKDHRKHEDFKAFLSSSGSGKGLGLGALGIVLLLIIPFIIIAFLRRASSDNPNMTISEFTEEAIEGQDLFGGTVGGIGLYGKVMAGIPETLQNIILPEPIREEIKARTGLDVDVANVFEPLFGAFTDLQQQRKEQREAK
jgi:hypothetical protein